MCEQLPLSTAFVQKFKNLGHVLEMLLGWAEVFFSLPHYCNIDKRFTIYRAESQNQSLSGHIKPLLLFAEKRQLFNQKRNY